MKIDKKELRKIVKENFLRVLNEGNGYHSEDEIKVRKLQAAYENLKKIAYSPDTTPEEKEDVKRKMNYISQYKTPHEVNMEIARNGASICKKDADDYIESIISEGVEKLSKVLIYDDILESDKAQEIADYYGSDTEEEGAAAWFEAVINDERWSENIMPKTHKYICELPQSDAEMYYNYDDDYYFAKKK